MSSLLKCIQISAYSLQFFTVCLPLLFCADCAGEKCHRLFKAAQLQWEEAKEKYFKARERKAERPSSAER